MSARIKVANGDRFERLTVVEELPRAWSSSGLPRRRFLCRCDCGQPKEVNLAHLRAGLIRSCGCLKLETTGKVNLSHGESVGRRETPEYMAWKNMRQRTGNCKRREAKYYIARGIGVCPRWDDFETFLADMGRRPSARHSIDRIDNNKGYSADNCRWATRSEQNRNRRCTMFVEFRGHTVPLAEVSDTLGIGYTTLYNRVVRGQPLERSK